MNWFQKKLFGFILGQIHKRLKMRGWISAVSGLSMIASGVGMILSGLAGDTLDASLIENGWGAILAGGTVLGLGRKFDRITDRLEAGLIEEQKRRLLE